ncbi:hypothetical protein K4L06_13515 [Lysobacter sp. BMK333-48F3]|uniref:hypothetical protein n=1 Tax=Lysobacter sp. BMK333-48F3 TaxID=2867962 RepID=UPI001C8C8DE0|nr:hypothetical protein [Lysobacter sp. BMK333-48F3]MBX9402327.1 hypothetical protein [Lysobacter sp. BMK333-48F3]
MMRIVLPMRWRPSWLSWLKIGVLVFFVVLVLAPYTGWLMSLPMWAMTVFGQWLSPPQANTGDRWFRAGLVLAGVPSLLAVAWRAYEDRDRELAARAAIATAVLGVLLLGHGYMVVQRERKAGQEAAQSREATARMRQAGVTPAIEIDPPPGLSQADYEAESARLIRAAARNAARGDAFYRQQLAMLAQLARERPQPADAVEYAAAMAAYQRLINQDEGRPREGAQSDAAIERELTIALDADPHSSLAARELGIRRLRAFMGELSTPMQEGEIGSLKRERLRRQRDAAQAMFERALRANPRYDGAWRGWAWAWLYRQPELARGALLIDAELRNDAGGSRQVRARIDAAGGAAAQPYFEIVRAQAEIAGLKQRRSSLPPALLEQSRQPLPAVPELARAIAAEDPVESTNSNAFGRALGEFLREADEGGANVVERFAEPWQRGALIVASDPDLRGWRGSGDAAKRFDRRFAGVPRFRVVRSFELPAGLGRSTAAILFVPIGVDPPRGDLGQSVLLHEATGECEGSNCPRVFGR